MFKGFINYMIEVIAFGAVTEIIFPPVSVIFNSPVKKIPGFFDLVADFWQVNKPERRPVFLDQVFEGYTVKGETSISEIKTFLGEIIGLFNQVEIRIFHLLSNKPGHIQC